jgi:hypothetical protein
MGAPTCRGPLVFEPTIPNERYATVMKVLNEYLEEKLKMSEPETVIAHWNYMSAHNNRGDWFRICCILISTVCLEI